MCECCQLCGFRTQFSCEVVGLIGCFVNQLIWEVEAVILRQGSRLGILVYQSIKSCRYCRALYWLITAVKEAMFPAHNRSQGTIIPVVAAALGVPMSSYEACRVGPQAAAG